MTPEEKSLLERTYKLTEENNKMLASLRRSARISTAMRGIYWLVLIMISLGAYYFIQPYIDSMAGLYSQVGDSTSSLIDLLK